MVTANALSRLSLLDEFGVPDMNVKVHHLIRITPAKMEEFKMETAKDETLQLLSHQVTQGWADSVKKIDPGLKPYWPLRDDISIEDGLLLLGSRVIMPESLRGNILQQIRGGHLGMEKCKLRAKSCVYWPGIYKEIEHLANSMYQNSAGLEGLSDHLLGDLCPCCLDPTKDKIFAWRLLPDSWGELKWPRCHPCQVLSAHIIFKGLVEALIQGL